ncbi:transporter substrate-binding domain-containing protein [Brevibacillus fortis]|uniref:Amino acid ABC transporter substrate-binding protein n=1 Tax=Brevibacillus fortis TaxID=2126352 RepID=A0A2P7UMX7_9BACL|nr:transporter substrate-binding domain-containing protein [Brevibacillus fortis]MED1781472.1 transporter substrate-binding domain-containing protein [Brevibacillus fortis]PSJ88328.1 amino acid ABC transporter substrate-binding protein [Brevibacillus fortis]
MKANKLWKKVAGMGLVLMLSATALAGCGGGSKAEGGAQGTSGAQGAGTLAKIKERDKFVVGVKYDLNLFGLKDPATGNVEGFDIDIAKAIAKKVLGDENKIELKEVTSKTRIPMLKNGEIDAIIATMTITEDRKKEVDFSDVYFLAGQSFLVKKDSSINSLKDMQKGMKIVTAKGSTSAKNIRASAPDLEVLEFENYAEAFTALKAGQGDALTTDNALLYGMAKQDPNYRVTEETFTEEPYGIAISKGDAEFVKTVNDLLKEMKENGEYDKIYEKWIGTKPTK